MRSFFLVGLLFTFSHSALSAPAVTEATINDNGIEISGSNFGNDNPMLFWDDARASFKPSGNILSSIVPKLKWSENGNQWGKPFMLMDVTDSRIGKGKHDTVYFGTGHKNFLGAPLLPKVNELKNRMYVSWWYKPGMSPNAEGGSNKFIRIWDNGNGYGTRISWTQMHLTCSGDQEHVQWGSWNGDVDEWNHHAIYVDFENNNITTWVNGKKIHDAYCEKHSDYKDAQLYVQLLGFDHGSESYKNMTTAIDDIYIGSSLRRVEISNQSNWSPTMIKEILPIDSWKNDSITASYSSGIIKLSKDIYVYVVDDGGAVNTTGRKLNCPKCPKAPTE